MGLVGLKKEGWWIYEKSTVRGIPKRCKLAPNPARPADTIAVVRLISFQAIRKLCVHVSFRSLFSNYNNSKEKIIRIEEDYRYTI